MDEDEENLSGNFSNEMHSIDLASYTWRQIELTGKKDKDKKKSTKRDKDVEMDSVDEKNKVATVSSDGVFTMVVGGGSVDKPAELSKTLSNSCNTPTPRMKPGLVVCKGTLYCYGGVFEEGDKQYTLSDFYSIGKCLTIN